MTGFDMQVSIVLNDEDNFRGTSLTPSPLPRNGQFRTVWQCLDGTIVTHRHSLAAGMGFLAKAKEYSERFEQELPSWARPMPPMVIRRLCDIALCGERPLPIAYPEPQNDAATFARIAAIAEGAVQSTPV